MTFAPANLQAVRRLLLDHLDIHESSRAYPTDLDPAEVGIVGDPAHRGGYHCGRDRVDDDDYSVRESSRDRSGLTEAASALDIGAWSTTVRGKRHDLRSMSMWLVAQCKAGAADTRDIREIIYSPDGKTVRRWDRLGRRSTGDSSHRWHTHISYHRDATRSGRDLTPLYRRYLTTIGLLAGEDDDMTDDDRRKLNALYSAVFLGGPSCGTEVDPNNGRGKSNSLVNKADELLRRGPGSPAPVDVASLAEALAPHLEAAAERAVTRVLKRGTDATAGG